MTQREVCSKIFDVLNTVHSSTIPVTASSDLVEVAKRELIDAVNNWNSGSSPDPVIGALFLLHTSGAISESELDDLTELVTQVT
jgi:hypothetical protein